MDWSRRTVAGFDVGWPPDGDELEMHIYLDRSLVEVFVCGHVITGRTYELSRSPHLAFADDGGPQEATVSVWRLGSAGHG